MLFSRSARQQDALSVSSTFFGLCAAYVLTALLSISLATPTSALQTVPGSPCESTCDNLNFANDTVCLDRLFEEGEGSQFRECTTCLLNSTAVDRSTNISDVYWGLCKSGSDRVKVSPLTCFSQPSLHPRRVYICLSRRDCLHLESLPGDLRTPPKCHSISNRPRQGKCDSRHRAQS